MIELDISPLEIQKREFGNAIRGYNKTEVDEFIDRLLQSYESIYKENKNLKERILLLEEKVQSYKEIETTLKNTLVLAEKTAEEVKNNAQKERETILKKTLLRAEKILQRAEKKQNQITDKNEELRRQFYLYKTRFKNFLQSQLDYLDATELDMFKNNDPLIHDFMPEVAVADDKEMYQKENNDQQIAKIEEINDEVE